MDCVVVNELKTFEMDHYLWQLREDRNPALAFDGIQTGGGAFKGEPYPLLRAVPLIIKFSP